MAFVLDEKLTTKWFDTLTVIPDDGDNVWFIVGDKIYVGKYIAEARVFTKADKSMVDLSCVRQWSPMNGEKQICKQPEEDQVIAAKIPNLPCYVTGIYSSNLSQKNLGVDGPGLLLDQDYNISELGVKSPVSWEEVFDWYELPLEPLLLLPVIQVGLVPITYGELMSNQICLDCQCEEPKPQETEQNSQKPTSAIVASKNRNLMENNNEDKPMNDKLQEARVSYELTKYNYQPWGQAKEAWQYILDNDKFDEFDQLLEEWYPEGIDETDLNDILAYEPENVYEAIGLKDPYAEEDEEEEEEEEEDEEDYTPVSEEEYKGYTIYEWYNDDDNPDPNDTYFTVCPVGVPHAVYSTSSLENAKKKIDSGNFKESQIGKSKKSTVNKLQEHDDGWSDEVAFIFDEVMTDSANFSYEIQHCRRGVYTGATTPEVLAQAAYKIADKWNEAGEACEVLKEEDLDESKKSGKKLKEDYGWEVNQGEAWDLLDELVEALGPEEMLMALAKAMGTYELEENLAFICRQYDFRSQHLTNFEDEEDEEDLEESKKKFTERKVGNLDENVKEWYLKEHSHYDLGSKLNDNFTFKDVYTGLGEGKNIYDMFGVDDTLVRQHIFYELSKRLRVDNNVILSLWLGDWGNPYGESKKVKKPENDSSHLPESVAKQVADYYSLIKL